MKSIVCSLAGWWRFRVATIVEIGVNVGERAAPFTSPELARVRVLCPPQLW